MRNTIIVLALGALPALAGARDLRPGTFEIGGGTTLDFGSTTTEVNGVEQGDDLSTVDLNADALYYVVDNLGLGVGVNYSREEQGSDELSQSVLGIQAKYNLPIAPTASLLAVGQLGRAAVNVNDVSADGFAWLVGGGFRFFPADFVALDATISYASTSVEDAATEVGVTGWNVGVGFAFFFGGGARAAAPAP